MSTRGIRLFETTVERLARILSKTYGIRVVFKHGRCHVDVERRIITLPVVPPDASPEFLDAMMGNMDHEVAHLLFSDFSAFKTIERDVKLFIMTNALEDPRIERLYVQRWRGAAGFLSRSLEWGLRRQDDVIEYEEPGTGAIRKGRMWDSFDPFTKLVKAVTLWPQFGYDETHWFWRDVIEQVHKDRALFCDDLIRKACVAASTGDVIELAREILLRLSEPEQRQPPQPQEQQSSESPQSGDGHGESDEQDGQGQRGDTEEEIEKSIDGELRDSDASPQETDPQDQQDGTEQQDGQQGQQASNEPGEQGRQEGQRQPGQAQDDARRGQGDDGESQPADQQDDATGETSERGDQSGEGASDEPTGAGDGSGSDVTDEAQPSSAAPQNVPDQQSADESQPQQESQQAAAPERRPRLAVPPPLPPSKDEKVLRDQLLSALSEQIRQAAFQELEHIDEYAVYTTEGDRVERIQEGDRAAYKTFMEQSRQMVAVLRRTMSRSLLATRQRRWQGNQLRGHINPRALFHVPLGTSKRVFRHKVEAPAFDTALLIMVDHSASMGLPPNYDPMKPWLMPQGPSKMELATKTAVVLADVLDRLHLPFAVYGFSTGHPSEASHRYYHASEPERELFTRWGNLWLGVYKDFDDTWAAVADRSIVMPKNMKINTYDGESLRFGAQMLLRRPEKRKILLWLNDGYPEPSRSDHMERHRDYAYRCAREVERHVELLAFGIATDAVKNYYTNYVVVNDIKELPGTALRKLDELLRKGQRLRRAK